MATDPGASNLFQSDSLTRQQKEHLIRLDKQAGEATEAQVFKDLDFTGSDITLITGGTLSVGRGGTGATSLTDGAILLGSGTSAITALAMTTFGTSGDKASNKDRKSNK